MSIYDRLHATADRLITKYGQPVVLSRTSADGSVATINTTGLVVDTVKHALSDSGIQIGDDVLLLHSSQEPIPTDRINYNGLSRVVVDPIVQINPANKVLAFRCYARAG